VTLQFPDLQVFINHHIYNFFVCVLPCDFATVANCLVLPFNSPLRPIFEEITVKLIESGIMSNLKDTLEGNFIPNSNEAEVFVIRFENALALVIEYQ